MSQLLLQISDCHLGDQPNDTLLGLDADLSLSYVVDELLPTFDAIAALVCSGDLSNEGMSVKPYQRLLQVLPGDIPQYWLPGNHDDNGLMQQALENVHVFLSDQSLSDKWHISLLDSSIPRKTPGYVDKDELNRIEQVLRSYPNKHHLLFVHHHVLPVGSEWIDQQIVANAQQVLQCLAKYPQLKVISSGHVHQENFQSFGHIDIYTSPSTCVQFLPNSKEFALDTVMPGLRWFVLHDDGRYETGVKRIAWRELNIDHSSSGY